MITDIIDTRKRNKKAEEEKTEEGKLKIGVEETIL